MNTELVILAVLMGAATYPSRALPLLLPGMHRLPRPALDYLRLVGPAVLSALAAVSTMVAIDEARQPSLHVGIEWLAVGLAIGLVALRRGLLTATVVAALVAAGARAAGWA